MNVIVCGKVIPASSVTIEIDPNTKRMVRKGVTHELDPAAASAVEEALRLTEKHGGTVVLVTMGISDVTIGIRNALAMGATSAVHILDDAVAGSERKSSYVDVFHAVAGSPSVAARTSSGCSTLSSPSGS